MEPLGRFAHPKLGMWLIGSSLIIALIAAGIWLGHGESYLFQSLACYSIVIACVGLYCHRTAHRAHARVIYILIGLACIGISTIIGRYCATYGLNDFKWVIAGTTIFGYVCLLVPIMHFAYNRYQTPLVAPKDLGDTHAQ